MAKCTGKVRVRIWPLLMEALDDAALGWLRNDVPDAQAHADGSVDPPDVLLDYPDDREALLEKLRNRFACALEEHGLEFPD